MTNKNTEFLRAITGPKIEYNGSPTTRYSTWEIGGGIKVDENPFFGKLNLSIDDQHIIDLIDTHGGDSSLLTSDDANTFISASNDSLLIGFDQYSKKLVVEEYDPNDPGIMLSQSIETWDDIARDEAIWGSVGGFGKAFLRTNYAFVEDSNDKTWGFQWFSNVFEEHSHHGINISQGDTRLTFATVDTSSGDFYLGSNTQDYWSRLDIRKDNIEIRASKDYNETSFIIEPSGSSTNKPLSMGNNRITDVEDPISSQDVATKAYVDANSGGGGGGVPWYTVPAQTNVNLNNYRITGVATPTSNTHAANKAYVDSAAGIASTISQGEFSITQDTGNNSNVSDISLISRRYVRIGRTVILTGTIELKATAAGQVTAAFTGLPAAAQPANNYAHNTIISDDSSIDEQRRLNIWVYPSGDIRFVVSTAAAGKTYRTSFVMMYFGKAI